MQEGDDTVFFSLSGEQLCLKLNIICFLRFARSARFFTVWSIFVKFL